MQNSDTKSVPRNRNVLQLKPREVGKRRKTRLLGEQGQDINAWKTQRRDHTATSRYHKLNVGERNSEWNDERNGNKNGGENDQSC